MPNSEIKVKQSILERRQIAIMLPDLSDSLDIDQPNARVIKLSIDDAKRVLKAIRDDTRQNRAMVRSALDRATASVTKALENSQGIGSIPVGNRLYQFKIKLNESEPPIWRRIQVRECSLDKLHEHIQLAMGWTNSHLHRFTVKDEIYGSPELLEDGFDDDEPCTDSTVTKISEIVPKDGKRLQFEYEYDFGDSWMHEIVFEGCLVKSDGEKYPICVEGDRACPPEDVGGIHGYAVYLEAIADSNHEQHDEFIQWQGRFDPEAFDAIRTSKRMQRGLPNLKSME